MTTGPLTGFTIGVTAHRRAAEQIELLERRGATVLHGPAIVTHALFDEDALAEATTAIIDDPPAFTILHTGIGVRAWFEAAASLGLADALLAALDESVVLARGPKAHGAAVSNGVTVEWCAPTGTSAEVLAHLATLRPAGQRVAVQLDGAPGAPLAKAVDQLGAVGLGVPVYEWTLPESTAAAERLIEAAIDRRLDGLTFTARPQVENMMAIATRLGVLDEFLGACRELTLVSVGPVCTAAIAALGIGEPVEPVRHRLGSMVVAAADAFRLRANPLVLAGVHVAIQGAAVVFEDGVVALSDRERAVLGALAARPGVVVSKTQLLERVWSGQESDPHVVEVTIGRLRQRLGAAGLGIETVIRRGYRLSET